MKSLALPSRLFDIMNILIMVFVMCIMVYPFLYVLNYSLSDAMKIKGGLNLLPWGFSLDQYTTLFANPAILQGLLVSVSRSVIGTLATMIVSCMGAYAITKDRVPGIRTARRLLVFTLYFGGGLIPTYLVVKALGLVGTFGVYIFPALVNVFGLIVIRAFIESLPPALEESATIDGANELKVFWLILFPMCLPVVAAISVFTFLGQWNSYFDTALYNYMNQHLYTLQFQLYLLLNSSAAMATLDLNLVKEAGKAKMSNHQALTMAVTTISIIPLLIIFPLAQKYFKEGLLIGSIKG